MKQKIIIIGALVLLLVLTGYMVKDFFSSSPSGENPYDLKLDSLRIADTTAPLFEETARYSPLMSDIHCIATDKSGNIYVGGTDTLQLMDPKGKSVKLILLKGNYTSLCIDDRNMIIAGMQDHIRMIDPVSMEAKDWDSPGTDTYLTSVAVHGDDIYAADFGSKSIIRYNRSGKVIRRIGQKDPQSGVPGIILPSPYFDVAATPEGNIWAVNAGRHQLEKYDPDGNLLISWGTPSMGIKGFCGCCNPSHFTLLPDGSFITAEKGIERIKLYDKDGNFECIVASPDSFEEGTTGLDLAIDRSGQILVLDPMQTKIRVFRLKNTISNSH
ncbi:MAG: hypothetical protein IPH84_19375 [Bacteroidales bacterium]|nr:hypothetical protein [Bacteroidales bacterium]